MRWIQLLMAVLFLAFGTVGEAQAQSRRPIPTSAARAGVTVQMTVVKASHQGSRVDPRLRSLAQQLEMYRYSSYTIVEQRAAPMSRGNARRFQLDTGEEVIIQLLSSDSTSARCRIQIQRGSHKLLNSTVNIKKGSHLIYGISRDEQGAILLPITVL